MKTITILLLSLVLVGASLAGVLDTATTYRFQEGVAFDGTDVYGATTTLSIKRQGTGFGWSFLQQAHVRDVDTTTYASGTFRTLLRFDSVSSIPDWRGIASATCSVRVALPNGGWKGDWQGDVKFYARQINEAWSVDGVTPVDGIAGWRKRTIAIDTTITYLVVDTFLDPPLPPIYDTISIDDTTYDTTSVYWTNYGASPPTSASSTIFDSVTVGEADSSTWFVFDVPTTVIEDWADGSDNGILIHSAETGSYYAGLQGERTFWTDQADTVSWRPILNVTMSDYESATYHNIVTAADLPYTTSAAYDTVNIRVDSLTYTSPGAAITLAHNHSVVLFHGNTLFVDSLGIQISADSCKLYDGTVEQRAAATRQYALMVNIASSVDSCEVRDLSVHARTANSGGLRAGNVGNSGGPNRAIYITGGNYTSYVSDFDSREYQYTSPIFIADDDASPIATERRAHVSHVTIDSCPHAGIVMNGGTLECDSNFVRVDAQNHYTYPSGNIFYGTANSYGIAIDRIGRNCKVIGNTIVSGLNHRGGRGIALDGQASWTTWRSIEVAYNLDSIHAGPDANYGNEYQSVGVRIRDTGTDSLYFHHNTIIVAADTAVATNHTGPGAIAIWTSNNGEHWRFEHNIVKTVPVAGLYGERGAASSSGGSFMRCFAFDEMGPSFPDSIILRYNHIESDCDPISFGEVNSGSSSDCGSNVYSFNDTIVRSLTTNYQDEWGNDGAFAASLASCNFYDVNFTDPYFSGDSTIDRDGTGPYELWWRKSLSISVIDSSAVAVPDAEVIITNYNGDTVFFDTTDAGGLVDTAVVTYRLYQYGQTDSTYNPFAIKVQTPVDTVTENKSFGWATSGNVTIIVASAGVSSISVSAPVLVGTSSIYDIIALPRDKAVVQDNVLHIFPATDDGSSYSNTATRHYYSADEGATWTGVNFNMEDGGAVDMHLAVFGLEGRGIYGVVGDNVSSYFTQTFFKGTATSLTDAATQHHISTNTSSGFRGTVAARGDTAWAVWRNTSDHDTLHIRMSVDTFNTQTSFDRNIGGSTADNRLGVFTDDNGLPVLFTMKYSTGVYMRPWKGTATGFTGNSDSVVTTLVGTYEDRAMTVAYADGRWHYIYGRAGTGNDYLIHCQDTGSSWRRDTIVTYGGFAQAVGFAPKACVRNDSIFLAYGTADTNSVDPDPSQFSMMIFDPNTDTWSTPYLLTGSYFVDGQLTMPSKVPDTLGYIPYFFVYDGTVDSLMYGTVTVIAGNAAPVVTGIADQTINEGASFTTISLDNYVTDADNADAEMTWDARGQSSLTVSIVSRVATITAPNADWYGSETIIFRANDPSDANDEDTAVFTINAVNDAPVVTGIPDQTITAGSNFATITLDNYVSDVDNTDAQMTWTYSGNSSLTVSITDRVATITTPSPTWTGNETITFRATDPSAAYDDDAAVFTVNAAPSGWHKVKGLKRGHKPAEQGSEP